MRQRAKLLRTRVVPLLLLSAAYFGTPAESKAIDLSAPVSVKDILTDDQINELKNNVNLSAIRNGIRTQTMTSQSTKAPLLANVTSTIMPKVIAQISGNAVATQQPAMRDPANPDGLPIKLAPNFN